MAKNDLAKKKAFEYHESGFHCAEAVSKAIVEMYGKYSSMDVPKVATAFGGGIGRCKEEICGGLAGAFIAIGFLNGRSKSEEKWDETAELAFDLRKRFLEKYKTTNCSELLEDFGPQDNMIQCKKLSGEIASMLVELLEENNSLPKG